MKRPSFQFYPADWRNNAKLRRCSEAARGVWMDVLCVLHDSDEYGVCRWPLADLARAANAPLRLVKELADKDVLKGGDKNAAPYIYTPRHAGKDGEPVTLVETDANKPCWYSSRFVRDEWVRLRRGNATQFSADNQPPKPEPKATPKPPIGERQGDGPTSSSTSTAIPKEPSSPSPEAQEDDRLARWMFDLISQAVPGTKQPKFDKWANTIRLMRERDSLTHRQIAEVFAWANRDPFWKTNILSPDKLREKFPQLHAKSQEAPHGVRHQPARQTTTDRVAAALEEAFGPTSSGVVLEASFERLDPHEAVDC